MSESWFKGPAYLLFAGPTPGPRGVCPPSSGIWFMASFNWLFRKCPDTFKTVGNVRAAEIQEKVVHTGSSIRSCLECGCQFVWEPWPGRTWVADL